MIRNLGHPRILSTTIISTRNYSSSDHHFNTQKAAFWDNPISKPVWTRKQLEAVLKTHVEPKSISDRTAYLVVKVMRTSFDILSGYKFGKLTPKKVFTRAIFLETVAGVPGFAAAILRHLRSLRRMQRDFGWINTLLQEAENERMHLLTFIKLQQPGLFFRSSVILTQGVFMNAFFLAYLVSPAFCHRFVGYLEEEAVKTYGDIIDAVDDGRLAEFKTTPAPEIAIQYWKMDKNASLRDMILMVRADESNHRDVNHTFAGLPADQINPFLGQGH